MGKQEKIAELRAKKAELLRLLEEARQAENVKARNEEIERLENARRSAIAARVEIVGASDAVDARGVPQRGKGGQLEIEICRSANECYPLPTLGCPGAGNGGKRDRYRRRGVGLTVLQEFGMSNKREIPQILNWLKKHYANAVRSNENTIRELEAKNSKLEGEIAGIYENINKLRNVERKYEIDIQQVDGEITIIVNGPSDEEIAAAAAAAAAQRAAEMEKERAANEEKAKRAAEEKKRNVDEQNEIEKLKKDIADAGKEIEAAAGKLDKTQQDAFLKNLAKHNKDASDDRPISFIASDIRNAFGTKVVNQAEDTSTSELLEKLSKNNRIYREAENKGALSSVSQAVRDNGKVVSYFAYSASRKQFVKLALIKKGFEADDVTKVWARDYTEGDTFGFQYYYEERPFSEVQKILAEVTKGWNSVAKPDVDVSEEARRWNRNV